jgi:[ribosomal protein S18]-alanine N-acetyltransferase
MTDQAAAIIPATLAHAALMAEIHAAAFPPAEAWSRDVMLLQLELPTTIGLIHPLGGMVLARVAADEAEILTIAVHPVSQRLGIGGALLRAAKRASAAAGAVTMFLEVAVTNAAARSVYAAHGFTNAGRRPGYYAGGIDALVLRAGLAGEL